jgi:hypothetical protein
MLNVIIYIKNMPIINKKLAINTVLTYIDKHMYTNFL